MWASLITLVLSGFGLWAVAKYVLLIEMRIDVNIFKTIHDLCKDDRKFLISEEFVSYARYPVSYNALCAFKNAPWFYLKHSERLMQAGSQNKDYITTIVCFRWRYKALKDYLKNKLKEMQLGVPVEIMLPYFSDKIGILKEECSEPYVKESLWRDFDKEVAEVAAGKRKKTSALLYGPPGNSKTYFVKYLATKYRLPIIILTFNPDWNNHDVLLLFSQIPSKCIVLLEDFDNYFDKRKCIIGTANSHIKFTFDIILNGFDGVFNTYENVVFIMTANDIEKIDPAIRNRPSRFKFTRHFDNPDLEIRKRLLPEEWAKETEGFNLDQIFRLKEYNENGLDFGSAIKMLEKEVSNKMIEEIAYNRYIERINNKIDGDHQSDWFHAVQKSKENK